MTGLPTFGSAENGSKRNLFNFLFLTEQMLRPRRQGWAGLRFIMRHKMGIQKLFNSLISNQADVNATENDYMLDCRFIAPPRNGHKEVVQLLISNQADVNAKATGWLDCASLRGRKRAYRNCSTSYF